MTYTKVDNVKNPAPGEMTGIKAGDNEILVANIGGMVHALGDKCTHAGCRLSAGKIEGDTVKCKCHGAVFNIKTGEVIHGPAKKPALSYNVKVTEGELWVDM